jgi:hypothetical protein
VPQRAGVWTRSQVEATGDEILFPVKAEVAGSSPVRTASVAPSQKHNESVISSSAAVDLIDRRDHRRRAPAASARTERNRDLSELLLRPRDGREISRYLSVRILDPRARRRCALHPEQRALPIAALERADTIYGYSFILTNLDLSTTRTRPRSNTDTGSAPASRTSSATANTTSCVALRHCTVNFFALFVVPSGVATLMTPVFAPAGTIAVMRELESTVNCVAATPPNDTVLAPSRLDPWITTWTPTGPDAGEKLVIFGVPESTVTVV